MFLIVLTGLADELLTRGVVSAFYSNKDGHQIAVIRADRVFIDHQRMGFFRMGILPFVAAENVAFDVRDPVEISKRLASIHSQFARTGLEGPVELRNVSFSFPQEKIPRLQAQIIRLRADGVWLVLDGVLADGDGLMHFIEATLQPAGALAGRLSFQAGDDFRTVNLFAPGPNRSTRLQAGEYP